MIVLDSKCNDGYEKMLLALVRSRYESDKFFEDACKKTARDVPGLFKYVKDQARKNAVNGVCAVTDETAMQWILQYVYDEEEPVIVKPYSPKKAEKKTKKEETPKVVQAQPQLCFDF